MIINTEKLRTPKWIFIIYIIVTSLLIMIFRYILPGSQPPLLIYSSNWRFTQGLLELFDLFPALALSALVVPFGLFSYEQSFQSFSEVFFKRILTSVIIAICAAVIYGAIFFLALPVVKNSEENMLFKGELYQLSKMNLQERRNSGDWLEASKFFAICDQIWPGNPELADIGIEIDINLQWQHSIPALETDWRRADVSTLSGGQQTVNATQALSMSAAAFDEERYFDAHWLATLGGRLAISGSPEAVNAARLASNAWNMIASQAPNQREQRLYDIYSLKLSGYQAMNTGDWIRAYYIFQELLEITPFDPDAANFFAASERGALETAFFIDEMELSLGEILTGAVFSLPNQNGRAILRFTSLTTSADVSYGMGLEYMAFDVNSRPLASVRSRYAKLLPFIIDDTPKILILMHALDRFDKDNNYDSEWLLGDKIPGGIVLDISFEDFLLLSDIRRGLQNLQIDELYAASGKFNSAGYVYQIFQAEILNRLGSALFFLPMAVIAIVLAWRYRPIAKP
ncbi:MAG: hypothetical protein LBQ93_11740, partial [Treponema sp.]|nr:hypothetical protein [Treponema sp.]